MILDAEQVVRAFKKSDQIRNEYRATVLNGDANVISLEDLQWVIERMYGLKIALNLVPFDGEFIRGMVERWPDRLQIWVRQNQTMEEIRFTATKEMCHGIIDEEEDWSTDAIGTLGDLLAEMTLVKNDVAARATQSEVLAELVATELLYPYECQSADLQKLDMGTTTIIKIASYHKLPDYIVSRALSKPRQALGKAVRDLVNAPAIAAE